MSELTAAIELLGGLIGHESEQRRQLEQTINAIASCRSDLAERIQAGETTGDKCLDFALVCRENPESEFTTWHRQFSEIINIEALLGSLTLVITCETRPQEQSARSGTHQETLRLGLLSGELAFPTSGGAAIPLPMARHVRCVTGPNLHTELVEAPIHIGGNGSTYWKDLFVPLDQADERSNPTGFVPVKFDFVFGEEVAQWAIRRGPEHPLILRRMARLLGHDLDDIPRMSDYLAERREKLIEQLAAADAARDAALIPFGSQAADSRKPRRLNFKNAGEQLTEATSMLRAYLRLATELDLDDDPAVVRIMAKLPTST